ICVWTNKETAETFLTKHDTDYDQIKKIDIDRFVTYEIDDVFEEGEEVLMDPSSQTDGDLVNIVEATNELMSDLDEIRLKEFEWMLLKKMLYSVSLIKRLSNL